MIWDEVSKRDIKCLPIARKPDVRGVNALTQLNLSACAYRRALVGDIESVLFAFSNYPLGHSRTNRFNQT
jgi:hypothetical protein